MVEGAITVTVDALNALDTTEFQEQIRCCLHCALIDNHGNIGSTWEEVIQPTIDCVFSSGAGEIGPIYALFMTSIGLSTYQLQASLAAIAETSCAPCEDCPDCVDKVVAASVWNGGNGFDAGEVISGLHYEVTSTGSWCNVNNGSFPNSDANGNTSITAPSGFVLPGVNIQRLLYRLGTSGPWLDGGSSFNFDPGFDTHLYLINNDNADASSYTDNIGSMTCHICQS